MKGFKDSKNNFHPIKSYKKVGRKKREPFDITKDGVKISQKQLISMQRQPRRRREEPDRGWEKLALSTAQLEKMYINCKSNFAENGQASHNAIINTYTGSATSHVHGRTSCEAYKGYCYYCGLNIDALDERDFARKARTFEVTDPTGNEGLPDLETELSDIFDEVADIDTGEIDLLKLDKSAQENIEFILKREKKIKTGDKIETNLVDAREETGRDEFNRTGRGESGFYQYDYNIRRNGKLLPFSGTAFGSISHGDVIDMELEFYDLSRMTVKEVKS